MEALSSFPTQRNRDAKERGYWQQASQDFAGRRTAARTGPVQPAPGIVIDPVNNKEAKTAYDALISAGFSDAQIKGVLAKIPRWQERKSGQLYKYIGQTLDPNFGSTAFPSLQGGVKSNKTRAPSYQGVSSFSHLQPGRKTQVKTPNAAEPGQFPSLNTNQKAATPAQPTTWWPAKSFSPSEQKTIARNKSLVFDKAVKVGFKVNAVKAAQEKIPDEAYLRNKVDTIVSRINFLIHGD